MYLRKIDGYIIRKFVSTFVFMVAMLCIIIVVADVAEKVDDFTEQQIPLGVIVLEYYGTFLPFMVNRLAPICIFLTVVFFTAQMTQRSEVVAILSSGISFYRMLLPYFATAVVLAVGAFYLNAYVVPHAYRDQLAFKAQYLERHKQAEARNIHMKIDRGAFLYLSSFNRYSKSGYTVTLENFNDSNRLTRRLDAQIMQWVDSSGTWRLNDVRERVLLPQGERIRVQARLDTTFLLAPQDLTRTDQDAGALTLSELNDYIDLERERGSDFIKALERTRQERYAYPFATVILTFLAVALSTKKRRGGISLQIGIGLLIAFAYVLVLNTAPVALGDEAPIWVAVWLPNVLFLGVAVALVRIAPK